MRVFLRHKQHHVPVEVHHEAGRYRVVVDDRDHVVDAHYQDATTLVLTVDGRRFRVDVARNGRERLVAVGGETYAFLPESGTGPGQSVGGMASPEITAPMPGKIVQVCVAPGDRVAAGDTILILEAMKMENRLTAEADAVVEEVRVAAGGLVDGGQVLVTLRFSGD